MKKLIIIIALIFPIALNADVKLSPELECCIETNSKLQTQVNNQGTIIRELKAIHKDLSLKNDTLIHSLKIAIEDKTEKTDKKGFDFYSLLGALLGAMISGGAAILVFYLGKKEDVKKENKRLVDFGEQIFILIKNIIKNSEKQKQLFEEYIESLKEKPHTHGKYGRITLNLFERAKSFDTTLVFNAFKQLDLDNTSYIKYYTSLDYLCEFFNSVYEDYTMHNSQVVTPLSNNFLQLRTEILDKAALGLNELKEKGEGSSEIYNVLNKIIIDYYKSEDRPKTIDIRYDVEMIIQPIKDNLIDEKFASYEIADNLTMLAKRAGDFYQTILDQADILTTGLSSKVESVDNSIKKLSEIKDELENKYAS